jgi:hypothetical protein
MKKDTIQLKLVRMLEEGRAFLKEWGVEKLELDTSVEK